jgi:hypothetical protein
MPTDKLNDFIRDNRAAFDSETPPASLWDRVAASLPEAEEEADPLAEFIAIHRDAFDSETPPPRLFESTVTPTPASAPRLKARTARRRIFRYLGAIAAGLLLLFTVYQIGSTTGYRAGQEELVAQELHKIDPEFVEAERFYQQRIEAEYSKVNAVNNDPQLREDLLELDRATAEIRAQLLEVPPSQRATLVNELIGNYRTKLDILIRIQRHLIQSNATGAPASRPNIPTNES